MKGVNLDRRALLGAAPAGLMLAGGGTAATASDSVKTGAHSGPGGCATPKSAIARTRYGPVRGFVAGDVFHFKGIPYGDDTGGANRWLPAKPPKPWTDPYMALVYGANCPQTLHSWRAIEHTFLQDWDDGFLGEDMLKLNVWTPSLSGNRPVMVYFHGGGFAFGSSYELPSHEGAQMARNHDVVQVSVNHRLNVLGFFDVAELGGDAYADSVNVGMTDLTAALQWVQENIASFGGDPDKVMIYGQSGGGSKVTTLLGMDSAKGQFGRAIVMSGGGGNSPSAEQSRDFARAVVKRLDIGTGRTALEALQKMEWAKLVEAGNAVAGEINGPARGLPGPGAPPPATPRVGWGPTVDGRLITLRSYFDAAPDASRQVPVIIGGTSEEGMRFSQNPTEAEWRAQLATTMGSDRANALVDAMKKAHPEKAIRTLSYGVQGLTMRNNVQRMVKLKYEKGGAPVYQYHFQWQSPQLDGVAGAWHTAELAFFFDNTKRCEQGTGDTREARSLATKCARAFANFARTGNPSQPGLAWTPTDPTRCQTMVFDNRSRMVDDPEGNVRRLLLA
ncbi:carboxylesterase [Sphingomonas spermidinifaciens]|uniref:Carboxylic ester hydrolase n=1 Tax=Sphingomonas spermidinifaciens TaxID=1141889 RepID=A0A2A4B3W4_9SPHN|nr:carboxylesterase family protein [Sphingomonas spermidinifaciens]PCD02469.1 carboxylesterase [Sphingomonas spermidinifaciens]